MNLSPAYDALILSALALALSLVLGTLVVRLPRQIDATLTVHFPPGQRLLFSASCAVLGVVCGWRYGLTLPGVSATLFVVSLTTLGWVDALSGLLPDVLTLGLLWLGLLASLVPVFVAPSGAIVGAVAGYLFFWLLYQLFWLLTRREALGHGDFKLLAAMGAWLGWEPLMRVVTLASVLGVAITVLRRWHLRQRMDQPLYFGPYLALAGIVQCFVVF